MEYNNSGNGVLEQLFKRVQELEARVSKLENAGKSTGDAPSRHDESWLTQQMHWFNALLQTGSKEEVIAAVRASVQQESTWEIIDFADYTQYSMNHSYAVFSKNRQGLCFVMPYGRAENGNALYAAFPFPANGYWYERGKEILGHLYTLEKDTRSLFPQMEIAKVALVERRKDKTEDPDGYEYIPYQRGYLRING